MARPELKGQPLLTGWRRVRVGPHGLGNASGTTKHTRHKGPTVIARRRSSLSRALSVDPVRKLGLVLPGLAVAARQFAQATHSFGAAR